MATKRLVESTNFSRNENHHLIKTHSLGYLSLENKGFETQIRYWMCKSWWKSANQDRYRYKCTITPLKRRRKVTGRRKVLLGDKKWIRDLTRPRRTQQLNINAKHFAFYTLKGTLVVLCSPNAFQQKILMIIITTAGRGVQYAHSTIQKSWM